jgi:hypothetical protein
MIENNQGTEYFKFEEDFIEDNLRCIPMIVRMKLDMVGLKLSLKSWSRFSEKERMFLATSPTGTAQELDIYKKELEEYIDRYSKDKLVFIDKTENVLWENPEQVPNSLMEKSSEINQQISLNQWKELSRLQRFALIKLSRPGHESRNFPKAFQEFGLSKNEP